MRAPTLPRPGRLLAAGATVLLGAAVLAIAPGARAGLIEFDLIEVTTTADVVAEDGQTSLREAIDQANASLSDDVVVALVPGAEHQLTRCGGADDTNDQGDLDHTSDRQLEVRGEGGTVRQTCAGERVFHLHSGGGDFEEVTITGGRAAGADSEGGGIRSELDDVRIQDGALVDNHSVGNGGGVWVGSDRNIDFRDSLVADNVADSSGGAAWTAGEVAAFGSTVVDNRADVAGGALYSGNDVVRVNTSTLTGNSADDGGAIHGPIANVNSATIVGNRSPGAGGASIEVADLSTSLTVVAPDPAAGGGVACSDDAQSDGGSYDTDGTCGFTDQSTDTSAGGDPMLGPLQDNGGDLETMEPLPGSPLRDLVPPPDDACDPFAAESQAWAVDQRGVAVPQGGGCDAGAVETPLPFDDVPVDHPFFDEINVINNLGITTGFPDGGFHPAGSVTRQAMAAFLYRLAGADDEDADDADAGADTTDAATFSDVPEDHPFYDEIEWLVANGITTGYGDGTFRPADLVTRQAIAAFMFRVSELLEGPEAAGGDAGHAATFSDVPEDHPFHEEIEWLFAVGLTTGYPDGTYRPSATMTRQAMAAFLARAIEADLVGGPLMG